MLPSLPQLTAEQAEHWAAAALAEARALRQHDDQLYPATDDAASLRAAAQLHAAWARWADEAEALYDRIRPLLQAKHHAAGASDLDYTIGRTRAMLKMPPAAMMAREDQVKRGEVKSLEETRRELRPVNRP